MWTSEAHFSTATPVIGATMNERVIPPRVLDFETLSMKRSVSEQVDILDWKVRADGPLIEIVAHERDQAGQPRSSHYWVDPARGYNPTRVEIRYGDTVRARIDTTLALYGEVWAPARITHYWGDLTRPSFVVTVESASFDSAALPAVLTPEAIGVEVGTSVHRVPKVGPTDYRYTWDGQKIAPWTEVGPRIHAGELQISPAYEAACADQLAHGWRPSSAPTLPGLDYARERCDHERRTPALWENYVSAFVALHHLNVEQIAAAWKVHADCVDLAQQHLRGRADDLKLLEKNARKCQELADPDSEACRRALEAQSRVREPIERNFDKELVPRLDNLLTREQRAAVAKKKLREGQ